MLKASFVRTAGERDRIYVVRSDGSEVSWAFPTYGDALPHDLVHLVVEAAFGLADGFWGLVDAGADPARILAEANRRGGSDKFASFGTDRSELLLAEALANPGWLAGEFSSAAIREGIIASCRDLGVEAPDPLSAERIDWVRGVLERLASRWRGLGAKGALHLRFDAQDAHGICDWLSHEVAVSGVGRSEI